MRTRGERGLTIIELIVVMAIVAAVVSMAVPAMLSWGDNEKVKSAARAVSDAFLLARSEAIRTGDNHMVIFGSGMGAPDPIDIVNDGPQATANCTIDAGEIVHRVAAESGVSWGTSTGAANGTAVPTDSGTLPANAATGWTFSNGSGGAASWVLFQSDGLPRTFKDGDCTTIGNAGEGGGGIYVSNGTRDYAVVLGPLGTARVHKWKPSGGWSN